MTSDAKSSDEYTLILWQVLGHKVVVGSSSSNVSMAYKRTPFGPLAYHSTSNELGLQTKVNAAVRDSGSSTFTPFIQSTSDTLQSGKN